MKITAVNIKKSNANENKPRKAVASVTLDNQIVIHDIAVIKLDGRDEFVSMPNRKRKDNGEYMDIVHPINAEARKMISDSVLSAYRAL